MTKLKAVVLTVKMATIVYERKKGNGVILSQLFNDLQKLLVPYLMYFLLITFKAANLPCNLHTIWENIP